MIWLSKMRGSVLIYLEYWKKNDKLCIGNWNSGKLWGEAGGDCGGKTWMLGGPEYPGGPHPAEQTVERVLEGMLNPVYLLNITTLSQLRIDGHPSVYGFGGHRGMDCSHWCLAGVPDTWNHLFYAALGLPNNDNDHHL